MLNRMNRHLAIPGTYNVRDLGGYPTASGAETRWRQVLRADSLHRLDADGRAKLMDAGLRTVIDLRFDKEKADSPQPFHLESQVEVIDISLFAELNLGDRSASDEDDLLLAIYRSALARCGAAIAATLSAIAEADEGAVLFHCTAGKDRTGLVAAVLLLAVEVPAATIAEDYALTGILAQPLLAELLADMEARGQDRSRSEKLLRSEPATMQAFLDHLHNDHGGVGSYLGKVGLSQPQIARLRARLVAA